VRNGNLGTGSRSIEFCTCVMGTWEPDHVPLSSVRAYGNLGTGSCSIEFYTCLMGMGTGSCSIDSVLG
jgi:hypothetical protein